ncbi:MAG: DegT/DnrJ/EryC1/StrS family aminotransferase [Planctomycetota bacterium]|jgi:dTDP-4-amino-4,6-dideoxygalactose transaminase
MAKTNTITKYEQLFAEQFEAGRSFSFWKGRVALHAILKALGVQAGDEVILPGYTCVVDVNPIKYLGATPVYIDIEPATFNMNVELLEEKITPNTKVIIAQHTYGYPCDMDTIMNVANKSSIYVIEDSCHAFGSKYKGKVVGTFGKAAYFSFQWNKLYTTGIGGMVLTNDSELAEEMDSLCADELCRPSKKEVLMLATQLAIYRTFIYPRTTALAQAAFRYLVRKGVVVGSSKVDEYAAAPMEKDFFKAMSRIQASSGLKQLRKAEQNIAHRKKMAQLYDRLLEEKGWPKRQYDASIMEPVMVRYPVRIAEKDRALAEAARAGVELGSWFNAPLHQIETSLQAYDYEPGICPQAEKAAREVVNLPLHPRANEKTAKRTVEFVTGFTKTA